MAGYPPPGGHGGHYKSIQGQILEVNVVGCTNLRDKEWLSRQDPYVHIEYGATKHRTRTDTDGGRNPSFNEKFVVPLIEGLREINATVWNSNSVSADDYIGSTRVLIEKVLSTGYDDSTWPLKSQTGKYAGELRLIMHYTNAGSTKPGKHGAGHAQPPGAYPAQAPGAYPAQYPAQPGYATAPAYGTAPAGYPSQQQAYSQAPYPAPGSSGYALAGGYPPNGHQAPAAYPAQGYPPGNPAAPYPAAPNQCSTTPVPYPAPAYPIASYPVAAAPYNPAASGYPPAPGYPSAPGYFPPGAPGHAPGLQGYLGHGGTAGIAAVAAAGAYGMYSHGKHEHHGVYKQGKFKGKDKKKDKKYKSGKFKWK